MHFYSALLALTTSLIAVQAANIPDGGYMVTRFTNGTTIYTSLTDTRLAPIIDVPGTQASPRSLSAKLSRSLTKRRTDCWGYHLDESGVDAAAAYLADQICRDGQDISTGAGERTMIAGYSKAMMVYYCLNEENKFGNCDRDDVRYALGQMDAHCKKYEASWFGWPGSFELVGKARQGDNVCAGGMGGKPFN
ncbi:hypothetical protein BDV96DRAFT_588715 [Lophiotrema nucula]|uniref:Prokaryotic phospholipase A2-domain-containing protein n=1 Tax=Lophiotrema nucula TaxID=690887 RepID=A0A6A5YKZ2_9PLEO|nr:hypothetical protein BDV96DRAFT_588715 [Lophiotrema nucula]